MTKTVIFMRHGKAADPGSYATDFERPLVSRGKEDTALAAKKLMIAGFVPDLIVASPAQRTQDTAEAVCRIFGIPESGVITDDSLYHGNPENYLQAVHKNQAKTIMIIGHNPTIGQLSIHFSGQSFHSFPTSASAVFRFESDSPDLRSMAELMFFDLRK